MCDLKTTEDIIKLPAMAGVGGIWGEPPRKHKKSALKGDYDSFYDEIQPLLHGLAVFGKLPYKRTEERKCESALLSWQFVYWVIHYTVVTGIALEQLYESWRELTRKDVDFSTVIEHGIIFGTILLLHFPTPMCVFYERNPIVTLLNSWPLLLEQLEITLGEKFTASYRTLIKVAVWVNPLIIVGIVLAERNLFLRGKYWRAIMYVSLFQSSHLLIMIWFFSFLEMKNIARKIENAIVKFQMTSSGPCMLYGGHSLEDLRILWLRLSVVVQQTGEAFSLSVTTLTVSLTTVFIVSWFSVISSFIHPEYRNRTDYLTIGLITGFMVYSLCEPAHRVTEAAGERIIRALSFIELDDLPSHARKQVNAFTRTITLNYPTVSLSGLSPVNRSWLPAVAADVVTYLIVLVQFQASARP